MDAKKIALIIGIAILLPLFLGLFMDAIYAEPKYNTYCNDSMYSYPVAPVKMYGQNQENCTDYSTTQNYSECINKQGNPRFKYDNNSCQIFDKCDYCSINFNNAQQMYNRNLFFILAPIGLIVVLLGIYLTIDYIGAGLMFAGLITMFYATIRYFSDMSKVARALVILVELLIIIWIGYKKIDTKKSDDKRITDKIKNDKRANNNKNR